MVTYPHTARPTLARKPDNRAQGDQPGGRNRPSGKDRTPLLLRSLPSQDDGPAPATRWRRPSPLELPAARRNSSSARPIWRDPFAGVSAASLSPPFGGRESRGS